MDKPKVSYHRAQFSVGKYFPIEDIVKYKKEWIDYINSKYGVGYSEENACTVFHRQDCDIYNHFNIDKDYAHMWGENPENVINCKLTIIEDNVSLAEKYKSGYDENCIDYFGWVDYRDDDNEKHRIQLIQPNIKCFSIQFPGGGDYEASQDAGKIVRLKVEQI